MEVTYEQLKSLIVSEEIDGMMIKLKLKADNQETPIETVAVLMPDQDEMMKNVMMQAGKAVAINAGINVASNALGGMIGGVGGSIASSAGSTAASQLSGQSMNTDKIMQTNMTDEKKQKAILAAFANLQMYYEFQNGKWLFKQNQQ